MAKSGKVYAIKRREGAYREHPEYEKRERGREREEGGGRKKKEVRSTGVPFKVKIESRLRAFTAPTIFGKYCPTLGITARS